MPTYHVCFCIMSIRTSNYVKFECNIHKKTQHKSSSEICACDCSLKLCLKPPVDFRKQKWMWGGFCARSMKFAFRSCVYLWLVIQIPALFSFERFTICTSFGSWFCFWYGLLFFQENQKLFVWKLLSPDILTPCFSEMFDICCICLARDVLTWGRRFFRFFRKSISEVAFCVVCFVFVWFSDPNLGMLFLIL